MERRFFDWNSPFLIQTAAALIEEKTAGGRLDLSETVVAFPSRRGLRRFEEILADEVEKRIAAGLLSPDWRPPVTITVGKLPELFYELKRPFANSLTEILAWRVAFLAVKKRSPERTPLLFPFPPEEGDFRRETEMAGMLARLHRELASDGLDFTVPLQDELISKEADRWRVLREIQKEYLAALDRLGLWDVQTARIYAVDHKLCRTDKEIILVGAIDLNALQKKILDQTSDHVRAFIFAPETMSAFFDRYGGVIPDRWEKIRIDIPDDKIIQATNPVEEGERAAALAVRLASPDRSAGPDGDRIEVDSVAVGVPDPETIPFMTEEFVIRGIPVHPGSGTPARENRVFRLLSSAAAYLKTRSFVSFADWVRHPDAESFFLRSHPELAGADWISALDRFQNRFVPEEVDHRWGDDSPSADAFDGVPADHPDGQSADSLSGGAEFHSIGETASREARNLAALKTVYRQTENLFLLFRKDDGEKGGENIDLPLSEEDAGPETIGTILKKDHRMSRLAAPKRIPLSEWPSILSDFLEKIYPNKGTSPKEDETLPASESAIGDNQEKERQIDEGLSALYSLFDEAAEVPSEWFADLVGEQAIDFLLKMSAGKRIPPAPYAESVELIGWLDLALDDHPNLVIAGLNNGIVPSNQTGDLFLPNSMRHRLGIEDNSRRFARDAFFLSAILASRNVRLLFARRSLAGDPLLPSRLLLTGEPLEIARRVDRFFGEGGGGESKGKTGGENDSDAEKRTAEPGEEGADDDLSFEAEEEKPSVPFVGKRRVSGFKPPILRMVGPPPTSMRVTEFADFLASPYRYFLRRHLRLERLDDRRMELDAAAFGNIVHDVLKEFGDDPAVRESEDEKEIAEFLHSRLDFKIRPFMVRHPAGTVYVQTEQIRNRLAALARWQAAWRRRGTRIRYVEAYPAARLPFLIEGDFGPVAVRGRIDRIDYNEAFGQWFIFDYKTFDRIEMGRNDSSPSLFPGAENFAPLLNMKTDNQANKKHRKRSDAPPLCFVQERGHDGTDGAETSETVFPSDPISGGGAGGNHKTKRERWIDLQLPLYHKLAAKILEEDGRSFGDRHPVSGYVVLPKSSETAAFAGNWTGEELEEAFFTAKWVVRMIQRLWRTEIDPNAPIDPDQPELGPLLDESVPSYGDDFAPITGSPS